MKNIKLLAIILMVIGSLNWGLVGVFDFNLVSYLFGMGTFANVVYALVGLAGIYGVVNFKEIS